jgi:hypothetical protein
METFGGLSFLSTTLLSLLNYHRKKSQQAREIETLPNAPKSRYLSENEIFDVIIIGAGPAGATSAYYLGKQGLKVALIDKKQFPRPKPCGDAWCKPGLDILEEMGVLQKMEADQIVRPVQRGGFISPFGYRCINTDGSSYGSVTGCKTYAIKRHIADEYIVKAAVEFPSVKLFENTKVIDLEFIPFSSSGSPLSPAAGYYRATTESAEIPSLSGTMCLICDGSTSYLAQKMGIIPKSEAEAVCSHCYVKGGTHQWKEADGVMVFNRSTLPGYSALFRHYNDDMYFGQILSSSLLPPLLIIHRQELISFLEGRQPQEPLLLLKPKRLRSWNMSAMPLDLTTTGRSLSPLGLPHPSCTSGEACGCPNPLWWCAPILHQATVSCGGCCRPCGSAHRSPPSSSSSSLASGPQARAFTRPWLPGRSLAKLWSRCFKNGTSPWLPAAPTVRPSLSPLPLILCLHRAAMPRLLWLRILFL